MAHVLQSFDDGPTHNPHVVSQGWHILLTLTSLLIFPYEPSGQALTQSLPFKNIPFYSSMSKSFELLIDCDPFVSSFVIE